MKKAIKLFLYIILCFIPTVLSAQMLIVCAPEFADEMKPFIQWKTQKGMKVELITMDKIGSTAAELKNYVADYYKKNNNRYLLLVGDAEQIPVHFCYEITKPDPNTAYSDAEYGYISSDEYPPSVLVGRFSAKTTEDVRTQVERVIYYERDIDESATWLENSIGIADPSSNEKGDNDETDIQHIRTINDILKDNNYTTYEISKKNDLVEQLDKGCGIVNYTGHGYTECWATTGISVNDVNKLTNINRLPFIIAAGCQNGHFRLGTCLSEAFLRGQTQEGKPVGAIGMLGFTIQIYWNPPMLGQDEFIKILTSDNSPKILGEVINSAYKKVIEVYKGSGSDAAKQWSLFGDPSLLLRRRTPQNMNIVYDKTLPVGTSSINIDCDTDGATVALSANDKLLDVKTVTDGQASLSFPEIEQDITLYVTITAQDKVTHQGKIIVGKGSGIEKNNINNSVLIYPNPSTGTITLSGISSLQEPVLGLIYSPDGQLIKEIEIKENVPFALSVEPGTYFLQIPNKSLTRKIVVIH